MVRVAFVFALVFALATPAAMAAPFVGQDEAAITTNAYNLRARALLAFKDLGATRIRLNYLQWRPVDPDLPNMVRRAGMVPQLTVAGDTAYVRELVTRYRGVVSTYAVWNEPDLAVWRCCTAPFVELAGVLAPRSYRVHYAQTYRTIKQADPSARVMIGELSPHGMGRFRTTAPVPWFAKTLHRNRPLRADCVAVHPYYWFWTGERMSRKYTAALRGWRRRVGRWARLRALLTPAGGRVPVCNTEHGSPAQWPYRGQAVRAYRACRRVRMAQCAQYQMFPSGQSWDTSLTTASCKPRRAYLDLRKAIRGVPRSRPVPWKPCPDAAPFIRTPPGPGPYDRYRGRGQ
jgi:hypothetical protein